MSARQPLQTANLPCVSDFDPGQFDASEEEQYADAIDGAAEELQAAAAYIRRGNELKANTLIASALLTFGVKWVPAT